MDLQEVGRGHGPDSRRAEKGQMVGSCECGNETLGPIQFADIY